jgi:hypothetical protein
MKAKFTVVAQLDIGKDCSGGANGERFYASF